jgi:hypothetical protein
MPPDNNRVGQAIRPFAVGKSAWMFCDTQGGARASANLYSLVLSARANGTEPLEYLTYLYTQLPAATRVEQFEALLPWNVERQRDAKTIRRREGFAQSEDAKTDRPTEIKYAVNRDDQRRLITRATPRGSGWQETRGSLSAYSHKAASGLVSGLSLPRLTGGVNAVPSVQRYLWLVPESP